MQVDPNRVIQALGRRIANEAIQAAMQEVALEDLQVELANRPAPSSDGCDNADAEG